MALLEYTGTKTDDPGAANVAGVLDDLATPSFFAARRVVLVREADKFISVARQSLEAYLQHPAANATLVLECRSFPKTTRLYKQVVAVGGEVIECKRLAGRALVGFVIDAARERGKRISDAAAEELVDRTGPDQGLLDSEVEKLSLYVGDRAQILPEDVGLLVGRSREEKIFAVMDAAGVGDLSAALARWREVLDTDSAAVYRAMGGIAFALRKWISAQHMIAGGAPVRAVAPKVMMWGREAELAQLVRRLPVKRMERLLSRLAELDMECKTGLRSIHTAVEDLLVHVATPAA